MVKNDFFQYQAKETATPISDFCLLGSASSGTGKDFEEKF